MTKKVILTRGLPGSGKSTWCKQEMEAHPGQYKRVNKDSLREMSDFGRYTGGSEKHIIALRNAHILYWLEQGFSVLIDDTGFNLVHERVIRDLVKGTATVEFKDFTDVSLELCIEHDLKRFNSVGEAVIRKMYNQYLRKQPAPPVYDKTLPDAILVDMDGTYARITDRSPYDTAKCEQDSLDPEVARVVKMYARQGVQVLILSGRKEQFRPHTTNWLLKHASPYTALYMRADDDDRRDSLVKRDIYEQEIAGRYNVLLVLDDRKSVVNETWRPLGLRCWQVAEGDY